MGSPYNIPAGSAARLFPQDKASAEYKAICMITESLAHPQRTLLSAFIRQASDRELASRYFLNEVPGHDKVAILEFLADWNSLLTKVRPVVCSNIDQPFKQNILRRDEGRCCISKVQQSKIHGRGLLFVYVLPPWLLCDDEMAENGRLYKMLAAFIGEPQLQNLRSVISQESKRDRSDQVILLSPREFGHFRNGRHSLESRRVAATEDSYLIQARKFIPYTHIEIFRRIALENKAIGFASPPNPQPLGVHHRFADALAWLEISDYMKLQQQTFTSATKQASKTKGSWGERYIQHVSHMFRYIWVQTPASFRAFIYSRLAGIANQLYEHTGSDRTYRLPFNHYLRVASGSWSSKHRSEFQALHLVEKLTRVPAPRPIDALQYGDSSFLLMTGLPGKPVGRMIPTMTDEQLRAVALDLGDYVAELRNIHNETSSGFQICNAVGAGILDWRIGDSQREELTFRDEKQFNEYLTHDLLLNEDAQELISKSHGVEHNIVFTHAVLNMRNIFVDGNGKISGIVDWECAGWYPEYWEYTKAHFTARVTVRWIVDVIDKIFPHYGSELQAEDMLSNIVPPW